MTEPSTSLRTRFRSSETSTATGSDLSSASCSAARTSTRRRRSLGGPGLSLSPRSRASRSWKSSSCPHSLLRLQPHLHNPHISNTPIALTRSYTQPWTSFCIHPDHLGAAIQPRASHQRHCRFLKLL